MAKKKVNKGGRPTIMTESVVVKLEQAFAIDCTVEEACSYSEISRDAFYDYLKKNPKFSDRIAELRLRPILKARQTVVKSLDDTNSAYKYLSKKARKEFGDNLDITSDGKALPTPLLNNVFSNNSNASSDADAKED